MSNNTNNTNNINYNSMELVQNYYREKQSCCSRHCNYDNQINKNLEVIIKNIYKNVNIEEKDKELMLIRYINIIKKIEKKYRRYSRYYTFTSLFTSIASILVTAFISINNLDSLSNLRSTILWWISWSLSLSIALLNSVSSFYKWDRKYLLMFKVFYKLEQEIWMYLELVGPYSINSNGGIIDHKNKLSLFYSRIELIYKRVNDNLLDIEENDQDDKDALKTQKNNGTSEQLENNSIENLNQNFIRVSKKTEFPKVIKDVKDVKDVKDETLENLSDDIKIIITNKEKGKEEINKYKENV